MGDIDEYRCFVGSLSWSTTDRGLKDAFEKFGHLVEAKVVIDKFSGRSRGFGFVSFDEKRAMEEAIEAMNGMDLDGRSITVERSQPGGQGSGRARDGDYDRGHGHDRDSGRSRGFGGSKGFGGGGGGDCFKCGKPGHFARECPSGDGGRGGRFGGRDDRRSGGDRYGPDRGVDRYGGGGRYVSRGDSGSDRHNRDRGGPYELLLDKHTLQSTVIPCSVAFSDTFISFLIISATILSSSQIADLPTEHVARSSVISMAFTIAGFVRSVPERMFPRALTIPDRTSSDFKGFVVVREIKVDMPASIDWSSLEVTRP
ncbi:hypothetical protein V2J09_007363 [Rumex salicifolius]